MVMAIGLIINLFGLLILRSQLIDIDHDLRLISKGPRRSIRRTLVVRDQRDSYAFLFVIVGSFLIDLLFLVGALVGHLNLEGGAGVALLIVLFVIPTSLVINLALKHLERQRLKKMTEDDLANSRKTE